jgi:putative pyruvate formate lyase activating enzyme
MSLADLPRGSLAERAARALAGLTACILCARRCGADRTQGIRRASCRIGRLARVAHWGEWQGAPAGFEGAGAILFAGCNLRCLACNTWQASWENEGAEVTARELADIMLGLQAQGRTQLALVSPSHVPAQILEALVLAAADGLTMKLVWDSGGYDSVETLGLFDGVIDFYVPDVKHGDAATARICTGVADYPAVNARVVAEMVRQVGGERVVARHLVLPNGLAGTEAALAALPAGTQVEVMANYQPVFRANRMAKLNRSVTEAEIAECMRALDGDGGPGGPGRRHALKRWTGRRGGPGSGP